MTDTMLKTLTMFVSMNLEKQSRVNRNALAERLGCSVPALYCRLQLLYREGWLAKHKDFTEEYYPSFTVLRLVNVKI